MERRTTEGAKGPQRVLLVAMEYTPKVSGGVGTYVFELARGLVAAGRDVAVLAYTPGAASVTREPGLEVHLVPPGRENLARAAQLSLVQGVLAFNDDLYQYARRHLDAFRPDVVHFHQWHTRAAARRIADDLGVPAVGTSHHLSEPTERWWGQAPDPEMIEQERLFYDGSTHVITVSRSMGELLGSAHGLPADRITVIHCALDLAPFLRSPYPDEAFADLRRTVAAPGEHVVLYTGRIHPQKGIAAIFAAAERVLAERPNVVYLLAGGTDSRESTRMARELSERHAKARPRVKLLGKLPRKQLRYLHRIADLALVPSVYEPFGYTALESMASGLPLVASDAGGLGEIVRHDETGLLVPVREAPDGTRQADADALAEAQLSLLADPARARRFGEAGRASAVERFQLPAMVEANLDVYRRLAQHAFLERKKRMNDTHAHEGPGFAPPRFPARTPDELRQAVKLARGPALLEGTLDRWPARTKWTFDWFRSAHGDLKLPVEWLKYHRSAEGTVERVGRVQIVPLRTFVDALEGNDAAFGGGYLIGKDAFARLPALLDDAPFPRLHASERLTERLFFMGARGVFTQLHYDRAHNLHAVLVGRKRWQLYRPEQTGRLAPARYEFVWSVMSEHDLAPLGGDPGALPGGVEPDYDFVLGPGETLYLPYGWWHRVLTLEPAIATNFWWWPPALLARQGPGLVRDLAKGAIAARLKKYEQITAGRKYRSDRRPDAGEIGAEK